MLFYDPPVVAKRRDLFHIPQFRSLPQMIAQ